MPSHKSKSIKMCFLWPVNLYNFSSDYKSFLLSHRWCSSSPSLRVSFICTVLPHSCSTQRCLSQTWVCSVCYSSPSLPLWYAFQSPFIAHPRDPICAHPSYCTRVSPGVEASSSQDSPWAHPGLWCWMCQGGVSFRGPRSAGCHGDRRVW